VSYRSPNAGLLEAYVLRKEANIPTTVLLHTVPRRPLGPSGVPDTDVRLDQAAQVTVSELSHVPQVTAPAPQDPSQPIAWQDNPIQTSIIAQNNYMGVYNTSVKVYALHSCNDVTDHYAVTALADWTATHAQFQSASVDDGTMFLDSSGNLVVDWQVEGDGQDASVTNCGAPPFDFSDQRMCRYVNYPKEYILDMTPPPTGMITQLNAAPAGSQGQATTYTSGFTFSVGGTVNVSGMGAGGGITANLTWTNTTSTTVPALMLGAGNRGNEGAFWTFTYCTMGDEKDPNPGTDCTPAVQTTSGCRNRLGDNSGKNPQQGQTPNGKFSNAVQSVHWEAGPDTRVGSTFDIAVTFQAIITTTTAHLSGVSNCLPNGRPCIDPDLGCTWDDCSCVSEDVVTPQTTTVTFEVPFPSTQCQSP
jgi:hypothetical protein